MATRKPDDPETSGGLWPQTDKNTSANPALPDDIGYLDLRHVIGFEGDIIDGLVVHPLGKHIIYAVGSHVVVEEIVGNSVGVQQLLMGHTNKVTCIAVSHEGQYLASGQLTSREMRSTVILWDWCSRQKLMEFPLHMGDTLAIAFLHSSYFVTLGGCDDLKVAVWSTEERKALIREQAEIRRARHAICIATSSFDPGLFVTVGEGYGRIWHINLSAKTMTHTELNFGGASRKVICAKIADQDKSSLPMVFCGTSAGTILVFHGISGFLQTEIPIKKRFPSGVTNLEYVRMMDDDHYCLLVGTGEGKLGYYVISMCRNKNHVEAKMVPYKGTNLWKDDRNHSAITSISKVGSGQMFYVGTEHGHIYRFKLEPWSSELFRTCSHRQVHAIAFPRATDELLITGEFSMVRVFNLKVMLEVRRYERQNRTCMALCVNHDGTQIFVGWDSGDICSLGFDPKSIKLKELVKIDHAHKQAVTALVLTSTSDILISGGLDGLCISWRLVEDLDQMGRRIKQGKLMNQFADQRAPITSIQMFQDDRRCAVSSEEGTVTVYDILLAKRLVNVRNACAVNAVALCGEDLQFVTACHDGKINWWEVVDGSFVRELDACKRCSVNTLAMEVTKRQRFVTGGDDRLVKFWKVVEGTVTHVGIAHSHPVTKAVFGPCGTVLVTAGKEGAIFIWAVPHCS